MVHADLRALGARSAAAAIVRHVHADLRALGARSAAGAIVRHVHDDLRAPNSRFALGRKTRRQSLQPGNNFMVCRHIGGGQRRLVILVLNGKICFVNFQYFLTCGFADIHYSRQQR